MLFQKAIDPSFVLCNKKGEVNFRDIVIRIKWQDRLGLNYVPLPIQFIKKNDLFGIQLTNNPTEPKKLDDYVN